MLTAAVFQCFQLAENNALELWKQALSTGWTIQLWRDEVLHMHLYIEKYFERIKGSKINFIWDALLIGTVSELDTPLWSFPIRPYAEKKFLLHMYWIGNKIFLPMLVAYS